MYGIGAAIKESILDVIVFGFPAKAISGLRPEERLSAIISQNQVLEGGWCATTSHNLDSYSNRPNPNKKACAPS
jgi:hypothetical protein